MVLLFDPTGNTANTFYFDNLTGPSTLVFGTGPQLENNPTELYQNFPNPVTDKTSIDFLSTTSGKFSLKIYDVMGNLTCTIVEKEMKAGKYSFPIDVNNFANGIYFYELKQNDFSQTRKMVIAK
jgi:hypothetical protein